MLHFDFIDARHPNGTARHIGDVHPFWHKGKLYLYYLSTDGSFSSRLATTTDFFRFTGEELRQAAPAPAIGTYYVLGVTPYGGGFVSYFGASDTAVNGSFSEDLTNWRGLRGPAVPSIHYRSGRDPYLFFDPEAARWRIVYTAYRSNDKGGGDFDAALSLLTSRTEKLEDGWEEEERELVRFDNAGLSRREDPECSQMMRLGDRWYLFYSVYSRTVHGVGGLSYRAGEAGLALTENDWERLPEHSLDGEDLCAAQVFPMEGKTCLLGWIPQTAAADDWGGALSFPREVYPLPGGALGLRLPEFIREALRGETVYELPAPVRGTEKYAEQLLCAAEGPILLEAGLEAGEDSRWGLAFRGREEYSVTWDGGLHISGYDRIARPRASCSAPGAGEMALTLVLDGDIMEVFLNGRYALAARLGGGREAEKRAVSFFSQGQCLLKELKICRPDKEICAKWEETY